MGPSSIRSALLTVFAALLVVVPARAQAPTGSIAGRVVDVGRAPIPGLSVNLASPQAAEYRHTATNANGEYSFADLPPSTYFLTFQLFGFKAREGSLSLSAGETARVDISMVTASLSDTDCPPGHWHWLEDVSAGYAFAHDSATGTSLPAGWTLEAAGSGTAHTFSWVGELSGNYRTAGATDALATASIISALGGVRKGAGVGPIGVSGRVLGGVSRIHDSSIDRSTTSYAFALQPGVSIAVGLKRFYRWSLHGDVDARFFPFAVDGAAVGRGLRFTAGVAYSIPRFLCI